MKQQSSSKKANWQSGSAVAARSPVGEHGAMLAPPAYGIDFADSGTHPLSTGIDAVAGSGAGGPSGSAGGRALPAPVQSKMERAFDADFSSVRLHEGPLAHSVGALAVTRGSDIHFAPGLYAPDSQQGQQLLGHELTHVVQQASGRVGVTGHRGGFGINSDRALEREADEIGIRAARGERVHLPSGSASDNAGAFRRSVRDFQDAHSAESIRQGQARVLGEHGSAAQTKDSSSVLQCYGSVAYAANVWPAVTGKKTTNLSNDYGTFKVDHGLTKVPGASSGEYEIEIEMTPNKNTGTSNIRFVQAVRRGKAPGNWSTKATDPGMTADRARRAAAGGWRVDRADPTTDKTPFYGHQIDGTGTLVNLANARPGKFGGAKPWLYDAPSVSDPLALEFSSDAMDDTTGVSYGKVAWGFQYSSATKTYQEETPRMLPASTNWFLNMFSEDRRRVAGERAGRQKWNEVYGAGGTGTQAGDANVKKVLGV